MNTNEKQESIRGAFICGQMYTNALGQTFRCDSAEAAQNRYDADKAKQEEK